MSHVEAVLWGGFAIGLTFGAVGQRSEFCLAGGLREWWVAARPRRAAMFLLAVGVAVFGTQAFVALGWVGLGSSLYYQASFSWLLVPLGGLLFGYGMTLARGCSSRALVLLGEGNLRSLVVLLCLGIAAAATLTGPLARLRIALGDATRMVSDLPSPSLPGLLVTWGAPANVAAGLCGVLLAAVLAAVALGRLGLRAAPLHALSAAGIGLLPPLAWWVTSTLGADDFEPVTVESLTFVAPIGDTIQYLMLSTGTDARFGTAVVAGVLVGSALAAVATGSFAWRGFDSPQQMLRSVGGGVLMGVGGALALGCSIGQGLTGVATLSFTSMVAAAGILAGAWLALAGPLRVGESEPAPGRRAR